VLPKPIRQRGAATTGCPAASPFAFAGLWPTTTPKDADKPITSCSIITTAANAGVRVVHDRMPVILGGPDAEVAWL
jgi:putative SOS response-associated peptidase YedK